MENQFTGNNCKNYVEILLIDSDETNHLLVQEIFCYCNISIVCANCGCSGIKLLNLTKQIHLILMEMKLKDMDGFTLFTHIKEINPEIPIIALTASVMENMCERCINYGFHDFVSKPISLDAFKEKILECVKPLNGFNY